MEWNSCTTHLSGNRCFQYLVSGGYRNTCTTHKVCILFLSVHYFYMETDRAKSISFLCVLASR